MTLSLLQVHCLNYFPITYAFNTLVDFFKVNFVYLTKMGFLFLKNHSIQEERDIQTNLFSLYLENCIIKIFLIG